MCLETWRGNIVARKEKMVKCSSKKGLTFFGTLLF
jgi:hypothetical protein